MPQGTRDHANITGAPVSAEVMVAMASARELSHNHEMKFSLWRSCLLGTLCVGLVGCASAPVRESVRRYESGDFAGSRAAAKAALARSESDDDAWGMKLRAELALGDAGAVMETYAAYQQRRGSDDAILLRDVAQATLGQGLKSPAARVRMAAIVGVEAAEIEDLADAVMALLGDDNPQVAVTAALAVLSGHPDAAKIAEIALKNDDPAVRRIAVNGVGKKVGMLAVADIRAAATDHDAGVRRIAVRWLGQLKDADSVDTLRGRLRDKDDGVRGAAATALAKIATNSATKLDLAGMAREQLKIEGLATRLGAIDLAQAAHADDLLRTLAQDDDVSVALAAVSALSAPDATLALAVFERARKSESYAARAGAMNVAPRAIGKEAALPYYRELTNDPNPVVRLTAARQLAHAGGSAGGVKADVELATTIFAAVLEGSADFDNRLSAAVDLAALHDSRGLQALSKFTTERALTADERTAAAAAHRMARVVTPGLVAALADASGQVRVEAASALLAIRR